MLGTKQIEDVLEKESEKLLEKFGVAKVFAMEVCMKISKKKAKYIVFLTTKQPGAGSRIEFDLRKSLKKTVERGLCGTLKAILTESDKARTDKKAAATEPIDEKAVKKYLKKRSKKMLKVLRKK